MAIKEVEHLGRPQACPLDGRIAGLVENLVGGLEKYHLGRGFDGHPMERIRRLRLHLARRLLEFRDDAGEAARVRQNLDTLLFCENLNAQSLDYLRELPTAERLSETVQRIEETVDDGPEQLVGSLGAVVDVGPAIDPRTFPDAGRNGADPLMRELSAVLQGQLDDLLAEGPPPAWNCPPSCYVGGAASTAVSQ